MKSMLTVLAVALAVLTGCGSSDTDDASAPTSNATSPTASAPSSPAGGTSTAPQEASAAPQTGPVQAAEDLVGTWEDPDKKWVVRFAADGTYEMDFIVEDFQTGTYSYEAGKVTLTNDEGSDTGTVDGEELTFPLGTLKRK